MSVDGRRRSSFVRGILDISDVELDAALNYRYTLGAGPTLGSVLDPESASFSQSPLRSWTLELSTVIDSIEPRR
jgi:hypothetical protein